MPVNRRAFGSGASCAAAPAMYFGNTIWVARAVTPALATLAAGARMWAMVPLVVPWTSGPNNASGAKLRSTPIEAFLRLTGRGSGTRARSCGRTRVSSSDSRRQPRLARAPHRVLLPEPGGAGRITPALPRWSTAAWKIR